MKKILAEIEKEIAKARKAFWASARIMDDMREIPLRDLTQSQNEKYSKAIADHSNADKAITQLLTAQQSILKITNNN